MGDNSNKKKIQVNYFFMRNLYIKFRNISIHDSKHAMHRKATNGQKFQRAITPSKFH